MKRLILSFLFLSPAVMSIAQPSYPQGYFRNPLRIPILLAGNFGECRPGHFHSGIDIKTGGKENEPVYAAADGYVSRIKTEPGGFGHALYVTHPNGFTTLYAHLNDYNPALQRFLRQQQYAKESWTQDIPLKPEQFPVKKGEQIAWSGNTGGSTAPHLHFEIRDTKTEHPLNPQLFGFSINDTRAPVPTQLAIYTKPMSIYEQDPQLLALKSVNGVYRPVKDTIPLSAGSVPLGLIVNDYMNGSDNTLAFLSAEWYLGGALQGRIILDDIGYDETRYLHAYADYKTHEQRGVWIQLLYQTPGNRLDRIYHDIQNRGAIEPGNAGPQQLRIVLKDAAANETVIEAVVIPDERKYKLRACPEDSIWAPNVPKALSTADYSLTLGDDALYDEACGGVVISAQKGGLSKRYRVLSSLIPAHSSYQMALRQEGVLPFALRNKVVLRCNDGGSLSGRAATLTERGQYGAKVRGFGEFWLEADTSAPVVTPATSIKGSLAKAAKIVFRAEDRQSSVKRFRGELDGKWILFEQHGAMWTYVFDPHCSKGSHELKVTAEDESGNVRVLSYSFVR
jgi:hypothetical protein